jgi:hypothetical protein
MRVKWMIVAILIATSGSLAFAQAQQQSTPGLENYGGETEYTRAGTTSPDAQPINFPHSVHAGTYQMDCTYCHYSVERSNSAGIPPVSTCMGCHTMIAGEGEYNQSQINMIREYWAEGETIPWVRIHKVADHVHFPHLRHVAAGLDCTQCHGPVAELQNGWAAPHENWGKGKMGWCISCHMDGPEVEVEGGLSAENWEPVSRDCTVCHY